MYPEVYSYLTASEFVKALYFYELKKNPKMTLGQFAKMFGVKTHTAVHNFINGKRTLTKSFIDAISERYKFDKGRVVFLNALVSLEKDPSLRNDPKFIEQIDLIRPIKHRYNTHRVEDDEFYHNGLLAICLTLTNIKNFSIEKACRLLDGQFTRQEVTMTYEKLKMLGLFDIFSRDIQHFSLDNLRDRNKGIAPLAEWMKKYMARVHNNPARVVEDSWWSGGFVCIEERYMEDIRKFINSKSEEFMKKFSAENGTSDNLSYVLFTLQRVTKRDSEDGPK